MFYDVVLISQNIYNKIKLMYLPQYLNLFWYDLLAHTQKLILIITRHVCFNENYLASFMNKFDLQVRTHWLPFTWILRVKLRGQCKVKQWGHSYQQTIAFKWYKTMCPVSWMTTGEVVLWNAVILYVEFMSFCYPQWIPSCCRTPSEILEHRGLFGSLI